MTSSIGITNWEARQIEAHQRHLEAENAKLRAALKWALDWIYACTEVPLPDEEPEDNASYVAALELVKVPG